MSSSWTPLASESRTTNWDDPTAAHPEYSRAFGSTSPRMATIWSSDSCSTGLHSCRGSLSAQAVAVSVGDVFGNGVPPIWRCTPSGEPAV